MGETNGGLPLRTIHVWKALFMHNISYADKLYASILNRIEVIKLQSYDNRKIAKKLSQISNEISELWGPICTKV